MKRLKVKCLCHEEEHEIDKSELGRLMVKLRKNPNSHEHMVRISKLAVKARARK